MLFEKSQSIPAVGNVSTMIVIDAVYSVSFFLTDLRIICILACLLLPSQVNGGTVFASFFVHIITQKFMRSFFVKLKESVDCGLEKN